MIFSIIIKNIHRFFTQVMLTNMISYNMLDCFLTFIMFNFFSNHFSSTIIWLLHLVFYLIFSVVFSYLLRIIWVKVDGVFLCLLFLYTKDDSTIAALTKSKLGKHGLMASNVIINVRGQKFTKGFIQSRLNYGKGQGGVDPGF